MPADSALPQVLPTDRLLANGVAVRSVRSDLRRIPNVRSALAVVLVVAEPMLIIAAAIWISHPLGWLAASRAVPAPTTTASTNARNWCRWVMAAGPLMPRELPVGVAIRPSND